MPTEEEPPITFPTISSARRLGSADGIWHSDSVSGDVLRRETGDEDNFLQCGEFFRSALDADARERLTDNIVAGQIACAQEFIQERAIANFTCAEVDYG